MAIHSLYLHLEACTRVITFSAAVIELPSDDNSSFWKLVQRMNDHLRTVRACKAISSFDVPAEQSIKGPLTRLPQAIKNLADHHHLRPEEYLLMSECVTLLRDIYINPPPALQVSQYHPDITLLTEAQNALLQLEIYFNVSGPTRDGNRYILLHRDGTGPNHYSRTPTMRSI